MTLSTTTYGPHLWISLPKIHTDLLWGITFLFIGLACFYFVGIFFYRNKLSASSKKIQQRKSELAPMISEFLFYDENGNKADKSTYIGLKIEIRQLLKNDFNRKVLSEILLDLQKDVSGDTQKRLFKLYLDLGLEKDAYKKLQSWRWEVISKGILELTQMQVVESYVFITQFINDRRKTIRKQAEIATVTLKSEGIAYFLDTTKYRISEWQQLKLLDAIRKLDDFQPPSFKLWLTSKNGHVVLFALRLIKYFNQNDCNASLIDLVKHKNGQIREEAIQCIKEFHVVEALDTLKLMYWKSSSAVKISVLDAIGQLGSEKDIEFLKKVENKEFNFSIKSKALSAINVIFPESVLPIAGIRDIGSSNVPESHAEDFPELPREDIPSDLNAHGPTPGIDSAAKNRDQEKEEVVELSTLTKVSEAEVAAIDALCAEQTVVPIEDNPTQAAEDLTATIHLHASQVMVDALGVNSEPVARYRPGKKTVTGDLSELMVVFEDVSLHVLNYNDIEHAQAGEIPVNGDPLNIMDIIVYDSISIASDDKLADEPTNGCISTLNPTEGPMEIEVDFTEVVSITATSDESHEMVAVKEEEDQTKIIEGKVPEIVKETNKTPNEMSPTDHLKLKSIIKDLIVFDDKCEMDEILQEFEEWSNFEWNLKHFDIEFVPVVKTEDDDATVAPTVEQNEDSGKYADEDAPGGANGHNTSTGQTSEGSVKFRNETFVHGDESIMTNNSEEAKMQLLDDIEALGDQREIPLLTEFLEHERCSTVKERVKQLIAKFSRLPFKAPNPLRDTNTSVYGNFKPFNVFEDLFRTSDTAKKLILMDEIVAVGDEKEIDFLKGLLEDPNISIRKKAQRVLNALQRKLSKQKEALDDCNVGQADEQEMEAFDQIDGALLLEYSLLLDEMEIAPPSNTDIFDVGFELSGQLVLDRPDLSEPIRGSQDSFLDQLWSLPVKIFDKLNG